jgi:hypothetical protein
MVTYGTWLQLAQSFATEQCWVVSSAVAVQSEVHLEQDPLVEDLEAVPLAAVQLPQAPSVELVRVHMATRQV